MKAALHNNSARKFFLGFLTMLLSLSGMAQTYTTKADGNWNSAATWVGGVAPGASIGTAVTINIKHDVTFNLTSDLNITGTLNITGDTLRFNSSYDKKVLVAATGKLYVKKGGFIQNATSNKSAMEITGGRIVLDSSLMVLSKNMKVTAGAKRTYKSSFLQVNEKYEMEGTSANAKSIDTIQNSTIQVNTGDFEIKTQSTLRVANAKIVVAKKFKTDPNTDITILTGSYGFDLIKTGDDLEINGNWDARIDAYCVGKEVKGSNATLIDFTRPEDCSTTELSTPAPELSFTNPVLKSGTDKKQGAVYRFSNITPGVDAEIKLKKISRSDIVIRTIDNTEKGWMKAFQPEFGLEGTVAPNQDWYIDFEMTFYATGTNTRKKVQRADFTALDVDGDGQSVSEYASFSNPANVAFASFSTLTSTPAGSLGTTLTCPVCHVSSVLSQCLVCHGTGEVLGIDCIACGGEGVIYSTCHHPFEGLIGNVLEGPVKNFADIDTSGISVMATFQYTDVDKINFRYGAKSSSETVSVSAAVRLNSMWSKSFSMEPTLQTLPVELFSFSAVLNNNKADLRWTTASEINVSHFIVEKSTDGKNFNDAGLVFAAGNSSNKMNYTFSDNTINTSVAGVVYYRLRTVDIDGKYEYSSVRLIRISKGQQAIAITTFPNPVSNELRVTIPAGWQGKKVMYEVIDNHGRIIIKTEPANSSQTETLNVASLAPGFYMARVTCGDATALQKIIKR
ncbi:MAG: T9SS type A sorting domain-containing protein [Chitinophagaceae bacterium]